MVCSNEGEFVSEGEWGKWRFTVKMILILAIVADFGISGMHQTIFMENCGDVKSAEIHSAQNAS